MAINSTGLQPDRGAGDEHNRSLAPLPSDVVEALSSVSLRCVECSALYPGIEAGRSPRYRCDCGGVLDVEMAFHFPGYYSQEAQSLEASDDSPTTGGLRHDNMSSVGAGWRQLFDERAAVPPIWPISTDKLLLDCS